MSEPAGDRQRHDALLEEAAGHHRAGRLAQAEQVYRQILADHADSAAALHGLGVAASQRGDFTTAIDLIARAIAIDASNADYRVNMGLALGSTGRHSEAIAEY